MTVATAFDFRNKPASTDACVVVDVSRTTRKYLRNLIAAASSRYGFTLLAENRALPRTLGPTSLALIVLDQPFSETVALNIVNEANTGRISIAFDYPSLTEMEAAAPAIEHLKARQGDRLNFLRPDTARPDGSWYVSDLKIVDNAACDTVRVKFDPVCLDDCLPPRLGDVWSVFQAAESAFARLRLWHRSETDGFVSVRAPNGFYITATKTDKTRLTAERVALVHEVDPDSNKVYYTGLHLPSSDSIEAACTYAALSEVNSLIHTHASTRFTRNPRFQDRVTVPQLPYGEFESGRALARGLSESPDGFVIMAEHGEAFASKYKDARAVKGVWNWCAM